MPEPRIRAPFCALIGASWLAACATPAPPPERVTPATPAVEYPTEVAASTAFLRARQLELDGRLLEAAEAYEEAARLDPDSAFLQGHLAGVLVRAGQPDRAVGYAERAFDLDPADDRMRANLASLYVNLRRWEDAVALLEPPFVAGELGAPGLFTLFDLYLRLGRESAAMRVGEEMIAADPDDLRGYIALGAGLERYQQFGRAEEVYLRGLEVDPEQSGLYDAIARTRRADGDQPGELAVWRRKLDLVPGDQAALTRTAQIQEEAGERDLAIETLEELVGYHPGYLGAQFRLGFLYYQAGRLDDAITSFEIVSANAGTGEGKRYVDEVRYFLGLIHHEAHDDGAALEVLEMVPPSSERFGDARALMARINEGLGENDEALADIRRAIAADPDNTALAVYMAGVLGRSGHFDESISAMETLIAGRPDDPDLYYDLGVIYSESGREDRALELMNQVLELEGDHSSALNFVGYSWADQGERLDEAEQLIRRAIELRPDDGYITDSLGWVHYQRGLKLLADGRAEEARRSFSEAIEQLELALALLERDDPVITWHLGDAYRSVSRFDDAISAYRRALDLGPQESDAYEIRREIELLELELQGAPEAAN